MGYYVDFDRSEKGSVTYVVQGVDKRYETQPIKFCCSSDVERVMAPISRTCIFQ